MAEKSPDGGIVTASALATLSLSQSLMMDELHRLAPEAGKRVAKDLRNYAIFIEERHGATSLEGVTTRTTVDMLTRTIPKE